MCVGLRFRVQSLGLRFRVHFWGVGGLGLHTHTDKYVTTYMCMSRHRI